MKIPVILQKDDGFFAVTGGRAPFFSSRSLRSAQSHPFGAGSRFRGLGMGETAALRFLKGMRRGQDSPVNKPLKKPAREPWN